MLAYISLELIFWGPNSGLNRERRTRRRLFASSLKRGIRYIHVVMVQWRQRNVQNCVLHVQDCCFANLRACLHGSGGLQIGEVTCGGSSHLSCKRDQIKMRDYMDSRVTPPKRVTSPTWGPPPPCKQALNLLLFRSSRYRRRCRC